MQLLLMYVVLLSRKIPFLYSRVGYPIFSFLARKGYKPGVVMRDRKLWDITNLNSIVERAIFLNLEYDKPTVEFIKHFVKEGDVCIDVGANIGYFTELLSDAVGKQGEVIAFEASPIHFKTLKRNMELNNAKNYKLLNLALSDTKGHASIFTMNSTGSIVSDYSSYGLKTVSRDEIEMLPLDDVLSYQENIKFIKIDVDGNELQVLKGAHNIIVNQKPMICIEICERTQQAGGSSSEELLEFLKNLGYSFLISFDGQPVSIDEVLRVSQEQNYIDVLCK